MSTLDSWSLEDSWDSWDSWSTRGGSSPPLTLLPQALALTTELLVYGPSTQGPAARPAQWPGTGADSGLGSLSPSVRSQVIVMELLQAMAVEVVDGAVVLNWRNGRSEPLPCPAVAEFERELGRVEALAELRAERLPEILAQLDYSPAFWAQVLPLSARETPYTLEAMATSVMFASFVIQRVKAAFNRPRPSQLSPRIQPIIPLPAYSTFPSGHATEAALVAQLLMWLVFEGRTDQSPEFEQWHAHARCMYGLLARRIAENRVVAGIHFPADNLGGERLATGLMGVLRAEASQPEGALASLQWLVRRARAEWGVA